MRTRNLLTQISLTALGAVLLSTHPARAQVTIENMNPDNSTLDASDADGATGGRVNGLAAVPGNHDVYYAASEWGGIYKTTDRGRNWFRLDAHRPVVTWDVEVHPTSTDRVIATSFYDGRVNSVAGINLSTDGGINWTRPASAVPPMAFNCSATRRSEPAAFGIAFDPATPNNVYVGTNCGVAISNNAGVTWNFVDPTPATTASNVWDVIVHNGGIIDVCGDDGHLRSTNGGANWTAGTGLPSGVCSLAVSPDESYVLFAVVGTRIFESRDGGLTWPTAFANPSPQGRIPFVATNQRSDSGGQNRFDLWFGDVSLHRATCVTPNPPAQGGAARCPASGSWAGNFTRNFGAHDDSGDIVFDTEATNDRCPTIFSSDGGVYYNTRETSTDCHSPRWEQPDVTPHGLWLFALSGANQAGNTSEDLYFGNQDNGTFAALDGGAMVPSWNNVDCCDGFDASSDPSRVLYTVCCFSPGRANRLFKRNPGMSGGGEINNYPGGNLPGFRPIDIIDNFGADDYVLVTTSGVFITNAVDAIPIVWTQLGAGTTPANACGVKVSTASGTPRFYVQAGTCNERNMANTGDTLWRFTGTGAGTWTQVSGGLPGGIGVFDVDPNNPNRIYASHMRAVANGGPRMVFSTDGGTSWQGDPDLDNLMTGGGVFRYRTERGPSNFTNFLGYPQPTLIAFDPEDANIIVAGGRDSGIFLSTDGGEDWRLVTDPFDPVSSGVPHLPRPWFAYFDHEPSNEVNVVIGTQGRGVWRINFLRPPVADADGPYVTNEGTDVVLDASGSSDADGTPLTYAWDYDGDGFDDAVGVMPVYDLVGQDGIFGVAVEVTDGDGAKDTDSSTVTVLNVAPSVLFGIAPNPQNEGSPVVLNGFASDPGWLDPLTASVSWGDGNAEGLAGVLENVRPDATLSFGGLHVYLDNLPANAPYSAEVCVADDDVSTCQSQPIQILNVPPTVTASPDQLIFEDDPLASPLLASFTDPGILDTHTASINWGDGSPPEPAIVNEVSGSGTVSGNHVYASPGVYTVVVTVTDKDGGVGADSLKVTVVHGFLRYCLFAEREGTLESLSAREGAILSCGAGSDSQGIASNSEVQLKPDVRLTGKAVSLQDEVGLSPRAWVDGSLDVGSHAVLGTDSRVTGNVVARGDVTLGNRSRVDGDVTTAGVARLINGASVGGTLTEGAILSPIPDITWVAFSPAPGANAVRIRRGESIVLPPGSYGALTIQSGGSLRLTAGKYVFASVDVGPGARLETDFSGGGIVVDVAGNLDFQPSAVMSVVAASGGANDILFRVAGSRITLGTRGSFFGTFLAPVGNVVLHEDASLHGALYGRTVDVHGKTTTVGDPALELFVSLFVTP